MPAGGWSKKQPRATLVQFTGEYLRPGQKGQFWSSDVAAGQHPTGAPVFGRDRGSVTALQSLPVAHTEKQPPKSSFKSKAPLSQWREKLAATEGFSSPPR